MDIGRNARRILRAVFIFPLLCVPTTGIGQAADPIMPLVGSWDLPGTLTKIKIHGDRTVDHSRFGAGTIQYEEGSFFRIVYRQHHLTCRYEVRKYSDSELTFTIAVQPSDSDCELGSLRRAPDTHRQKGAVERRAPGSVLKDCDDCPELVVVPAGRFRMGSPEHEAGRLDIEGPQRTVEVSTDFAVGRYAITRAQFEAFVKTTGHLYANGCHLEEAGKWVQRQELTFIAPGFAQDGRHPVVCISWDDADTYVKWLSSKTGNNYRLLTEAEREYVSRAGTLSPYWWGNAAKPDLANYDKRKPFKAERKGPAKKATDAVEMREAPRHGTVPVHQYSPNPWGLYQVHGNVAEWVTDCWNPSYMGAATNSSAVLVGDCNRRVLRGGAWSYWPSDIRAAYRESARKDARYIHVGFRVARDLVP